MRATKINKAELQVVLEGNTYTLDEINSNKDERNKLDVNISWFEEYENKTHDGLVLNNHIFIAINSIVYNLHFYSKTFLLMEINK